MYASVYECMRGKMFFSLMTFLTVLVIPDDILDLYARQRMSPRHHDSLDDDDDAFYLFLLKHN